MIHMLIWRNEPRSGVLGTLGTAAVLVGIAALGGARAAVAGDAKEANPWSPSQVIQPADLASELGKGAKPEIVCVGFNTLYRNAHILGASYHGPASKTEGLEDLKKWAKSLARGQRIVLYCGCCPWNQCPNIRPAFQALKEMGFTKIQVLSIPRDLGHDWVSKNYPAIKAR